MQISEELEEIVAMGGFEFKETHVTGDPIKDDKPIKVLGLIWDTESDTRFSGMIPLLLMLLTGLSRSLVACQSFVIFLSLGPFSPARSPRDRLCC